MKFTAIASLILLRQAAATCPSELTESVSLNNGLATMYYTVDADVLRACIESKTEGYVAVGISPTGKMDPSEVVIGLPDEETVLKYDISAQSISGVVAMSDDKQTLTDTSITQEDGVTTLSFTKILEEDAYPLAIGLNNCIYALGGSNELGYHGSNRGSFELDLSSSESDALFSTVAPSPGTTLTGSTPASAESIEDPTSDDPYDGMTSSDAAAGDAAAAEGSPAAGFTLSSVASAAALVGAAALL